MLPMCHSTSSQGFIPPYWQQNVFSPNSNCQSSVMDRNSKNKFLAKILPNYWLWLPLLQSRNFETRGVGWQGGLNKHILFVNLPVFFFVFDRKSFECEIIRLFDSSYFVLLVLLFTFVKKDIRWSFSKNL